MAIFKSPSTAGRSRPGQPSPPNIRDRISGPIPNDDEFPMRQPGTGIAHEGLPNQLAPLPEDEATNVSGDTPSEVAREDKTDSMVQSGPSQASNKSHSPQQRKTNRSSTLRNSTVSDASDTNQQHRKHSTLKTALGKLFGRKKRNTRQVSTSAIQFRGPEDHHRSDPSALNRALGKEPESKRSASLPITEFDRALRSHSIGPDDIVAISSARNSLQVDSELIKRRAATTSRLVMNARAKAFGGEMIGLSPRPASTHGRDSQLFGDDDPREIGRAVTSCDNFTHRRRSRSLPHLDDIQPQIRRRSDEIRYWRQSYDPAFMSPGLSNSNADDAGVADIETPATSPVALHPKTPPQPFNFDPMVGMKITQAASLEDRIGSLEVHNQKLEKVVSKLFQVVAGINNSPDTPERRPPPAPRRPSATYTTTSSAAAEPSNYPTISYGFEPSVRYSVSRQSNDSFGEGHTFIGSIPPSTRQQARPLSNATIRGATSLPSLPRDSSGPFTADHYTTLKALLDTERAARQALESQVTKLSHKVNLMSRTSHRLDIDRAPTAYSTVSAFDHDEDDDEPLTAGADSGSEAFKTPREERPSHGFGAFGEELRDEEEDGSRKKAARTLSLSQLTLGKPKLAPPRAGGVNL